MHFVRRLLAEQRKRAVASILSAIEAKGLPDADQRELRSQILAAINQYHDTTLDILKSSVNDGSQVNEEALRLIAEFNRRVHEMKRSDG